MKSGRLRSGWAAVVLSVMTLAPMPATPQTDPAAALAEGNRLVQAGRLQEARETYAAGYLRGSGDSGSGGTGSDLGLLAYNLGTVAHRLGNLPEAVLWYRRAQTLLPQDSDLEENLELARRNLAALGVPPMQAPPLWGLWAQSHRQLSLLGVLLAWAGLPALAAAPRLRRRLLVPIAALSCASFSAGLLLPRFGPRPAVLLERCPPEGRGLPAGSEVWAVSEDRSGSAAWKLAGETGLICPQSAVGLLQP